MDADAIGAEIARRRVGSQPLALCTSPEARPHCVPVDLDWDGCAARLELPTASLTAQCLRANPALTLVWAPLAPAGYALILDGDTRLSADGDVTRVVLDLRRAVLHRTLGPAADESVPRCVPL